MTKKGHLIRMNNSLHNAHLIPMRYNRKQAKVPAVAVALKAEALKTKRTKKIARKTMIWYPGIS